MPFRTPQIPAASPQHSYSQWPDMSPPPKSYPSPAPPINPPKPSSHPNSQLPDRMDRDPYDPNYGMPWYEGDTKTAPVPNPWVPPINNPPLLPEVYDPQTRPPWLGPAPEIPWEKYPLRQPEGEGRWDFQEPYEPPPTRHPNEDALERIPREDIDKFSPEIQEQFKQLFPNKWKFKETDPRRHITQSGNQLPPIS